MGGVWDAKRGVWSVGYVDGFLRETQGVFSSASHIWFCCHDVGVAFEHAHYFSISKCPCDFPHFDRKKRRNAGCRSATTPAGAWNGTAEEMIFSG